MRGGRIVAGATAAGLAGAVIERTLIRRLRPSAGDGLDPTLWVPARQRFVTSFDGTRLRVAEGGPGAAARRRPAVVFLHGICLDMTVWRHQFERLAGTHRCIVYDARGHGGSSPAGPAGYSIGALVGDLRAVLDGTVGDRPVVLAGHSLGGMTILGLAAESPEEFGGRVTGAVLLDTTASGVGRSGPRGLLAHLEPLLRPVLSWGAVDPRRVRRMFTLATDGGLTLAATRLTNFGPDAPAPAVEQVVRTAAAAAPEVWTKLLPALFDLDLVDAARSVAVPSLVVVGEVDRLTPPAMSFALQEALPDVTSLIVRGAGHCALLERPDEVAEAIAAFVSAVGRRAPARAS